MTSQSPAREQSQPTSGNGVDIKPRSRAVTDGLEATGSRGMLRAVGMGDEDWAKPQIGVASSWNEITPCNLSLDRLAKAAKDGVHAAGGYPLEFGTISVSDGISMGHEGMHYSLVSREIIADSVETVMLAERMDGSVLLAGCDKSLPGMLMAAARLDLASVFLYAGSIMPGRIGDRDVTIIDAFEAVGACVRGLISREDVAEIERAICPGEGACGGMYTANTMASAAEALGMSLPGSAAPPAVDRRRDGFARKSGMAAVEMLRQGITARQILSKEAFENAIAVTMAFGGSTNAVLHLLAIANEAEVDLSLDDFVRVGRKVPHLGDLKPFGKYVMNDVDRVGGVPVVMKALLDAGLLNGDCLTVTGRTMAENLADIAPPDVDGTIVRALDNPIHPTGGITILHGSLAPEGAVVKSAGFDTEVWRGTARVFDGERAAMDALENGVISALPFANNASADAQRWQAYTMARGGEQFRIPDGYFLGPGGKNGTGRIGAPWRHTDWLFLRAARYGYIAQIDDDDRARARHDFEYWGIDAVFLANEVTGANGPDYQAALQLTATELLGEPERVDDVLVWRIRPGVDPVATGG